MPLRVLPDVEQVIIGYLRSRSEVTALFASRIFWKLPEAPDYPVAVVQRLGGAQVIPEHLDAALIQVDVWARTKYDARLGAATLQAVMLEMPNDTVPGAVVTDVADESGLTWLPDPATDRPRYTATYSVLTHP